MVERSTIAPVAAERGRDDTASHGLVPVDTPPRSGIPGGRDRHSSAQSGGSAMSVPSRKHEAREQGLPPPGGWPRVVLSEAG